jgi:uncharacterized protein (DUF58 family)
MFVARGAEADASSGAHRTRRAGEGTDFLDYRAYVPGDDLRRVDWMVYGRLRQLFVRLHESPRQLSVTVLVDSSRSMGFGEPIKLLHAQRLACALGFVALRGGDRVYAASFADALQSPPAGPFVGRRGLPGLVRVLQRLQPAGSSNLLGAVQQFRSTGSPRRGLVIVLSDFLNVGDAERALTNLLGAGARLLAVQVLDPLDRGAGLSGTVRLRDSESGRMVDVRVDRSVLADYREQFERQRGQLESFCWRQGQHYLLAETGSNYLELVCNALRSGGVLR